MDEPILSYRGEKLEGGYLILPKHMLITNKQCVKLDKSRVKKILAQILNKEEASDNVLDLIKLDFFQLNQRVSSITIFIKSWMVI